MVKNSKIIVIEKNDFHYSLIKQVLQNQKDSFTTLRIKSLPELAFPQQKNRLGQSHLCLLSLDSEENIEKIIKKVKSFLPHITLIILSSNKNEEMAVESLKSGAYDFFVKDRKNLELLHEKIKSVFHRLEIQEIKKEEEFYSHLKNISFDSIKQRVRSVTEEVFSTPAKSIDFTKKTLHQVSQLEKELSQLKSLMKSNFNFFPFEKRED